TRCAAAIAFQPQFASFSVAVWTRRSRAKDLWATIQGNRIRAHLRGRSQRFRSANRRYRYSGVPQKSRRQDRESLAAVSTSTKLIAARRRLSQRNPGNSEPQQTPHPWATRRQDARDTKLRANRRGSVVGRNHFGALVPRGLCSAARGNIRHGNLGLRY